MGQTTWFSNFLMLVVLCFAFISMFMFPSRVQSVPLTTPYYSSPSSTLTRITRNVAALDDNVDSPSSAHLDTVREFWNKKNEVPPTAQAPPSLPPLVSPFPSISSLVVQATSEPTPRQDESALLDLQIQAIPEPAWIKTPEPRIPKQNKHFIENTAEPFTSEPTFDGEGFTTKLSSNDADIAKRTTTATPVLTAIEAPEPTVVEIPNRDLPSSANLVEQVRGMSSARTQTNSVDSGFDGVSLDRMPNIAYKPHANKSTPATKTVAAASPLKPIQKIQTKVSEEPPVTSNPFDANHSDHDYSIRVSNIDSSTFAMNSPEPEDHNNAAPISDWAMAKDPVNFTELRKTIEESGKSRKDAEKEIDLLLSSGMTANSTPEPDDPSTSAEKSTASSKQNWSIAKDPVNVFALTNMVQENDKSRNVFPKHIPPFAPSPFASTVLSETPEPGSGASLSPCTTLPPLWSTAGRPLEGAALMEVIEEHGSTSKRTVEEKGRQLSAGGLEDVQSKDTRRV